MGGPGRRPRGGGEKGGSFSEIYGFLFSFFVLFVLLKSHSPVCIAVGKGVVIQDFQYIYNKMACLF